MKTDEPAKSMNLDSSSNKVLPASADAARSESVPTSRDVSNHTSVTPSYAGAEPRDACNRSDGSPKTVWLCT